MDDKLVALLEDSLIQVWSERDPAKRLNAMKRIYADDIIFYESDSGPAFEGHQAIDSLIGKLQEQWAPDFVFTLTKPVVINHGVSQAAWTLGNPGASPVASGMDIAIIENGLIKALYLYLDESAH